MTHRKHRNLGAACHPMSWERAEDSSFFPLVWRLRSISYCDNPTLRVGVVGVHLVLRRHLLLELFTVISLILGDVSCCLCPDFHQVLVKSWSKTIEVINGHSHSRLLSSRVLCFYLETFHLFEFKMFMAQRHEMLLGLRWIPLSNSY